jgi:hypothetical protein
VRYGAKTSRHLPRRSNQAQQTHAANRWAEVQRLLENLGSPWLRRVMIAMCFALTNSKGMLVDSKKYGLVSLFIMHVLQRDVSGSIEFSVSSPFLFFEVEKLSLRFPRQFLVLHAARGENKMETIMLNLQPLVQNLPPMLK